MSLDQHAPSRSTRGRTHWPLLLRVSEVAFELGLSTRRIYQMINAGELDMVKIGKASRVPSASLLKLAGQTAAPGRLPEGMGGDTSKAPK
jgi:excisionase family DNA binding protein